jgi:hypothetical protein
MSVFTRRSALLSALVLLACCRAVVAGESYVFEYHGWHVDASRASSQPRDAVVAAIGRQLDIVENVAMAQDIRNFMRTIPIWVDPSRHDGGPAHYDRSKGVDVRVSELDVGKPFVLRELLHAYQEQRMKSAEPEIQRYFQQARTSSPWPADAEMLRDPGEYFAATATVYLFGNVDRPPFSQGRLLEAQPEYWYWLGTMFDGFHGCE